MFRKKKNLFTPTADAEAIQKLPLLRFEGKIVVIDELGREFDKAVRYLKRRKVIGFDTETRPVFSPRANSNGVALLQLSSGRKAFLFRVFMTGMEEGLWSVLADPGIIKVGAAVADDSRGMQKIDPCQPAGFVDLQRMCSEYGIRDKSVKKLGAIIMGGRISKTQQLSNWEAPRLSDAQQVYAATDAWVCREMYMKLLDTEKRPLEEPSAEKEKSSDGRK